MQSDCLYEIEKAFVKAEEFYQAVIPRVPITFSKRMTHCAGRAFYTYTGDSGLGKEIRLSASLLAQNGSRFVKETPGHEAAHIIAITIYGREGHGHGARWQEVMQLIGLQANRTHKFTVPKKQVFKYVKNGIVKQLTLIRHNKLQRGKVISYRWKDGTRVTKENFII